MSNLGNETHTNSVAGQFLAYDGNGLLVPAQRGNFIVTFSGPFTTDQETVIYYTKIDDVVTLHMSPTFAATTVSNPIGGVLYGIPEFLRPIKIDGSDGLYFPAFGASNSTDVSLLGQVTYQGFIAFGVGATFANFAATGNGGFYETTVTYKTSKE